MKFTHMNLNRMESESELQYQKRLVYGKLVDKTLADIDYSELAMLLYGKEYSTDVARRMVYGTKMTLDMIEDQQLSGVTGEDILAQIEEKTVELKKCQQRFFDQRREYNKLVAMDSRSEHLENCLIAAADRLNETVGHVYDDVWDGSSDNTEAVLVFCDWHYGLCADNVWNKYDAEICKERVRYVTEKAIDRISFHGCRKLNVVLLGDFIHGAIHTSARVASEELTCEQIMNVSEILAQTIERLASFVEEVDVYTTYGNHARTVQNKKDNIHRDNMERIIPWWLEYRLKDSGANVHIVHESENEFLFLDVNGHGICASHGDLDSVKSSPRMLHTLFHKRYGKDVEYILLADKHHRESFEELGVTSVICGALCGADEYANGKRLYSTPEQLLLIVTDEDGVDAEYHIKC